MFRNKDRERARARARARCPLDVASSNSYGFSGTGTGSGSFTIIFAITPLVPDTPKQKSLSFKKDSRYLLHTLAFLVGILSNGLNRIRRTTYFDFDPKPGLDQNPHVNSTLWISISGIRKCK